MKYHFKFHKDESGYWAECIELKGCMTQADTLEELIKNAEEALNLYLDEPADSKLSFPLPKKSVTGKNILEVAVEPRIAFANRIKQLRIKHHYTQQQLAESLGMKNIYSYQRLEKSGNPTLATISKIKKIFPELRIDDL